MALEKPFTSVKDCALIIGQEGQEENKGGEGSGMKERYNKKGWLPKLFGLMRREEGRGALQKI